MDPRIDLGASGSRAGRPVIAAADAMIARMDAVLAEKARAREKLAATGATEARPLGLRKET